MIKKFTYAIMTSMLLFVSAEIAAEQEDAPTISQQQMPYVSMNIGVEINGLEQAAEEAAQGLTLIGESLDKIASNHELTPEQSERVQQSLARVDELGRNLNLTVDQLPGTVEKSIAPVVKAGNDLSDQIRMIVILTVLGLVIIILVALAAVYYFVLAPSTRSIIETTDLLNKLANTLESTAKIVDKSSQQNRLVLEEMRKLQAANE